MISGTFVALCDGDGCEVEAPCNATEYYLAREELQRRGWRMSLVGVIICPECVALGRKPTNAAEGRSLQKAEGTKS